MLLVSEMKNLVSLALPVREFNRYWVGREGDNLSEVNCGDL